MKIYLNDAADEEYGDEVMQYDWKYNSNCQK